MKKISDVPAIILAGGRGNRLYEITDYLPKPAVPFGKHKIIDFMLSNVVNSGFKKIILATQYLAHPLNIHVQENWPSSPLLGFSVYTVHPQQAHGNEEWYRGTADAIGQNIGIIKSYNHPTDIGIFSGDHIVAIDFGQMFDFHVAKNSMFTICALEVESSKASRFGVIGIDDTGRIISFEEKPFKPAEIPGKPGRSLVSMGHYFAQLKELENVLSNESIGHDFGQDIIPKMLNDDTPIFAYNFTDNVIPGQTEHYWQDVGTIDSYWKACMDLLQLKPSINLYNKNWRMRTPADNEPMGKNNYSSGLFALAGGSVVEKCTIDRALIGRNVRVYGSVITATVIFDNVYIDDGCQILNAIICEGVTIPAGTIIGHNRDDDKARGLCFDRENPNCPIVIVPHGYDFAQYSPITS